MATSTLGMTYCRFAANRVRAAREALKLTKAETARRAMITSGEYSRIESNRPACKYISKESLRRLAVTLGLTSDFIATGKTDARPLPPNDPRKPLLAEITLERKRTTRWKAKWDRDTFRLGEMLSVEQRAVKNLTQMFEAAQKMRADDAAYIRELLTLRRESIAVYIEQAAARAEKGEPMRPDPMRADPA